MKKILLFLLVGVAAVIAFRVYRTSNSITLQSPTPSPITTFTLAVLNTTVSVKSIGESEFRVVSGQVEVQEGDEIQTDTRGRAKLLYPNGTITTLEADTHLKIEALQNDGDRSRLTLLLGSIWSKVSNILGTGDYYEIETENTVASVRGTVFATEFRNRRSRVVGIEGRVRTQARDPIKKQLIEGAATDITSGEEISIDSQQLPKVQRELVKTSVSTENLRTQFIKRNIEDLSREDVKDIKEEHFQNFVKRVRDVNAEDRKFVETIIEHRLILESAPSSPSVTPSPTRSPLTSPTVSPSPKVTPSPTLSPSPLTIKPTIKSVSPKTTTRGNTIAVNGDGFMAGRNVPQIKGASLNKKSVPFAVIDSLTLFADVPTDVVPGTYDVEVTTITGEVLILPQALIVQ
ncbi:MAG: FecR family protein [Patescibacteria group bacterium]